MEVERRNETDHTDDADDAGYDTWAALAADYGVCAAGAAEPDLSAAL